MRVHPLSPSMLLGVLMLATACGGRTGLPQGTGDTPTDTQTPANGALGVDIKGLPDGVKANIQVTSTFGFSQEVTGPWTLWNLPPGTYTVNSGTARDPNQASLGGSLDLGAPQGLARHPLVLSQNVEVPSGGFVSVTVTYPQPIFTHFVTDHSTYPYTYVPIEFILIPPGTFQIGSPDSEAGRFNNESPRHSVTIPTALYVSKTPCTQAQWMAVMDNNPSTWTAAKGGEYTNGQEDFTRPVETVSWNDIKAEGTGFLAVLNGYGIRSTPYRLPSEAEYEYATRAGTETAYFWGSDATNLLTYGLAFTSTEGGTGPTMSVGQENPNAWGLYDMIGNVSEWCEDDWHDGYTGAPTDGNAWVDSSRSANRILRSSRNAINCRSAFRTPCNPDFRDYYIGFRVVFSPVLP